MKNLEIHTAGPSKEFTGTISYTHFESQFGKCLVASTEIGVCNIIFFDDLEKALKELKKQWKKAEIIEWPADLNDQIRAYFETGKSDSPLRLHLHGTPFQKKVWEALLKIKPGETKTYGDIAKEAGHPKAFQAVGGAIGDNPIAYLIPCHRVLKSTGDISGYRWGVERKREMLSRESQLKTEHQE